MKDAALNFDHFGAEYEMAWCFSARVRGNYQDTVAATGETALILVEEQGWCYCLAYSHLAQRRGIPWQTCALVSMFCGCRCLLSLLEW